MSKHTDYKAYLAINILNDDKVITYRLLSRALKVHVNMAKEMLFEFHRLQNGKKPGSIHATYLVAGNRRRGNHGQTNGNTRSDGEDAYMQSSPFQSSPVLQLQEPIDDSSVLSITLVKEENLEEIRTLYDNILSIHVYSLGPHPLKDLQVLSDATREILDGYANEDPLDLAATYGSIINKGVRRRTGRRPLPSRKPETVPASKATASGVKPINVKEESKSTANTASPDAKNSQSSSKDFFAKDKVGAKAEVKPAAEMKGVQKPPQLKRESSSIFKSFAKAKPKVKSEGGEPGSGIDSAIPSGAEDVPMKDDSDEEEDDYVPPPQASKELVDSDRKSRIERQAALRKMMEDEDEEEPPTNAEVKEQEELNSEVNPHSPVTEQAVEISDGRRRGRRRVMKKKTIKDEEGYLVTREEAVWESFSEEELVAPKVKTPIAVVPKAKKPAGKPGQGNIMSFFGKKA